MVSSLLAVGIIFGDYVLVRNLTGTSFQNMQIYLYQTMKSDSMKASAVFVVIMAITFHHCGRYLASEKPRQKSCTISTKQKMRLPAVRRRAKFQERQEDLWDIYVLKIL